MIFLLSWLFWAVSVLAIIFFKILASAENKFLKLRFGPSYLKFKKDPYEMLPREVYPRELFYPLPSGKIGEGLFAIKSRNVNFFVYTDGKDTICIDSGYGDDSTREEFEKLNLNIDLVSHLFLTHGDLDHARGVRLFKNSKIYLSRDEEQMVSGKKPRAFWFYYEPPLSAEHALLDDGDKIRAGNIEIKAISNPGHTPGSMSYIINGSILFTGDIIIIRDGNIQPFYGGINMDSKQVKQSLRKLAKLKNISMICTAHTGCLKTENYEELMKKWT